MPFEIVVTERARRDIDEYAGFIASDSVAQAVQWVNDLESLILSLREMPSRFSLIAEADKLQRRYRSVNHHSHRVIYRIDDNRRIVYIIRLFHGARKALTKRDIE
jgi:plasmid stabilization system protein ParE